VLFLGAAIVSGTLKINHKKNADTLILFLTELKVLQKFLGNPHMYSSMPENVHNVEEKMCT